MHTWENPDEVKAYKEEPLKTEKIISNKKDKENIINIIRNYKKDTDTLLQEYNLNEYTNKFISMIEKWIPDSKQLEELAKYAKNNGTDLSPVTGMRKTNNKLKIVRIESESLDVLTYIFPLHDNEMKKTLLFNEENNTLRLDPKEKFLRDLSEQIVEEVVEFISFKDWILKVKINLKK